MYFSEIVRYTREHYLEHLPSLIADCKAQYSDNIPVIAPVTLDIASAVGGVIKLARSTLPQYAIDCSNKEPLDTDPDNLYLYGYTGQFQFLCSASNPDTAEEVARRHAWMFEKFCKEHANLHIYSFTGGTIQELNCFGTDLVGSMNLNPEGSPDGELWVAGGSMDISWKVSENGYYQHGS